MPSPSNEDRICAMFDSFSKTVSRNFVRNLDRAEGNRDKHFAEEPADYILELLGHEDKYPSESFVLYAGGHSCVVESETLYKALLFQTAVLRNQSRRFYIRWRQQEDTAMRLQVDRHLSKKACPP